MECIEEGSSELVVACGDGAVDLEVADQALDAAARAVEAFAPADPGLAIGLGRDHLADAVIFEPEADHIGIVALVGEEIGELLFRQRHQLFEGGAVRRFAECEVEGEREAASITETVNLTR